MTGQLTLEFMPNRVVPVVPNPNELVECEDSPVMHARRDCVECADGTFWSDSSNVGECEECGDITACDNLHNETYYCQYCHNEYFIDCYDCGKAVNRDDCKTDNDDDSYCESCYHERYTICDDCGEETCIDESHNPTSFETLCDHCFDNNWAVCTGCGDNTNRDDCIQSNSGDEFCSSCYCDRFSSCYDCGEELDHEDYRTTIVVEDLCTYCEDCAPRSDYNENWEPSSCTVGSDCDRYDKVGSSRKFGVELETDESPNYREWARYGGWGAVYDATCDAKEFVSPPLRGNEGYDNLVEFTRRMEDNDCVAGRGCGYHLHIDLSDTTLDQRKSIGLAYHYTCEVWKTFVARYRGNYHYCEHKKGCRKAILDCETKPDYSGYHNRYMWVNWEAYSKHRTVEVRSHEGTCDSRAVCNWVKAHTRFIDYVRTMSVGQITRVFGSGSYDAIMAELRIIWDDAELYDYYENKSRKARAA